MYPDLGTIGRMCSQCVPGPFSGPGDKAILVSRLSTTACMRYDIIIKSAPVKCADHDSSHFMKHTVQFMLRSPEVHTHTKYQRVVCIAPMHSNVKKEKDVHWLSHDNDIKALIRSLPSIWLVLTEKHQRMMSPLLMGYTSL